LAHGLVRASFVSDAQTQEPRGLLCTRKKDGDLRGMTPWIKQKALVDKAKN
jgi:hypothetical protein